MAVSLSPISRRLLAVGLRGDSGSEELSEDPPDPASKAKVGRSLSYCHLHSSNRTNLQLEKGRWGRGLGGAVSGAESDPTSFPTPATFL